MALAKGRKPANDHKTPGKIESEREPDKAEEETCNLLNQRIQRAKALNKAWVEEKLPVQRRYVTGEQHDDGAPGLVRTNLIHSTIGTNLPHVYAKNPDISCTPTDAVAPGQYEAYKKFGKTMERVLHNLLIERGKLKKRCKSNVRSTMTTGVGWLKVIFQADIETDPLIASRMNDVQENLKRIEYLKEQEADPLTSNPDAVKLELQTQLEALQAKAEIRHVRGFVLDRVLSEDILILDETIRDFDYYPEARGIAHRIWFTKERYSEVFGSEPPASATKFDPADKQFGGKQAPNINIPGQPARPEMLYAVWEIWYKAANVIYWVVEGGKKFCRPPLIPTKLGSRWYGFFALAFNIVDGRWQPMSDVEMLQELQDEYNTTRTNFADHRKGSIPINVVRTGGQLTPEDIKRIQNRKVMDVVTVEGTPGSKLQDEFANLPAPPIDPMVYDTTQIRADIDWVSGSGGDAGRGAVEVAKTATEAEILQQGMMSRTTERQDTNEDFLTEIANYCAEIALQELSVDEVMEIAGQDCTWPTLDKEKIWNLVQLRVRAGSTGKPNQQREREQWIQLLPEIQKTIQTVAEMRMQGQFELATSSIELLKETLQRFDEYIDIDRFIPYDHEEGGAQAQQQQQMQQMVLQLQQAQEQLQQVQGDLQKCQQDLQAAKMAEAAKLREAELKGQERQAEIEAKKTIDSAALKANTDLQRSKQSNDYQISQVKLANDKELEAVRLSNQKEIEDQKAKLQLAHDEQMEKLKAGLEMLKATVESSLGGTDLEAGGGGSSASGSAPAPKPAPKSPAQARLAEPSKAADEIASMVNELATSVRAMAEQIRAPKAGYTIVRDPTTNRIAELVPKAA